jgi:hypothetical protein
LRASRCFVLIITLALFFELISHGMLFRGTQRLLFMNQLVHLANPHDKLSALCVSKSCVSSIYRLTLWDLRFGHLSLLSYVGRRIQDGEHEL